MPVVIKQIKELRLECGCTETVLVEFSDGALGWVHTLQEHAIDSLIKVRTKPNDMAYKNVCTCSYYANYKEVE